MDELATALKQLGRAAAAAQQTLDMTSDNADRTTAGDVEGSSEALPRWIVRCTWNVVSGLSHPEHTYASHVTESEAIDYAVDILDHHDDRGGSIQLIEIHVKGPGREWEKVE